MHMPRAGSNVLELHGVDGGAVTSSKSARRCTNFQESLICLVLSDQNLSGDNSR
jgi:hypothetical protein